MSKPIYAGRLTGGILAALVFSAGSGLAAGPVRKGPVQVELLAQHEEVKPGGSVWLGLKFDLDPDWHLYWVNPGAAGFPPKVTWEPAPGVTIDPLQFPAPKVFRSAGLASYGYEKSVLLLARAHVSPAAAGAVPLRAQVSWLACDPGTCVPGDAAVSLTLRVGTGGSPARPEFAPALAALPEVSPWKMSGEMDREARRLWLRIAPDREPFALDELAFFLEQPGIVDPATKPAFRWEGRDLVVDAPLEDAQQGEMPGVVSGLLVAADGSLGRPLRLSTGDAGDAPRASAPGEEGAGKPAELPAATGEGWGSWLQKPGVVIGLAALMFLIGLNLLGVFEVGTALTGAGGKLGRGEGPVGSFLSGGLATIVATPCTAPFMGSAIFYALGQPPGVTLLIFTFLGLGMATPYLVLSRYPKLIEKLPRPGPWMETLKQGLAFPMFAVVIWLIWVLSYQVTPDGVLHAWTGLLLLALGAWWFGRFATPVSRRGVRLAARIGPALLAGLALVLGARAAQQHLPLKTVDVEEQIRQFQAEGKGVFVDFTAAWCLTCQANKAAMNSEKVRAAFAARAIEFLEVDWTQRDPDIHRVLQKYGREGVPLYLLFPPGGEAEPQVLPNLLTEDLILRAVEQRNGSRPVTEPRQFGFWGALLGAFLGGLILNLMPCVFPVVSLKILGFVAHAGSDLARVWQHGMAFAGGVLTFFWLLAVFLLGARAGLGM